MPSLNRARHQTTVDDETDKLALVDHKPQCDKNLLEIATFDSHLAWEDFRIKVKQIEHSTVHIDQWKKNWFQNIENILPALSLLWKQNQQKSYYEKS